MRRFIKMHNTISLQNGKIVKRTNGVFFRTDTKQEFPVKYTSETLTEDEKKRFVAAYNAAEKERFMLNTQIHPEDKGIPFKPYTFEQIINM